LWSGLNLKKEEQTSPESIKQKIEELSLELASIKAERDKLNNEATSWAEKRNSVHEQIRKLRAEANGIKEKRDALNQKVKELKNLREKAKAKRREKHNQILSLREKMRTLLEKKPSHNLRAIEKEIESLEWKIQTTPLDVKQEEEVISEVKRLEIQRTILMQLQELKNTLIELQAEEKAHATEAKSHHERLSELAEQSQRLHEQRIQILNQIQNLKVEADYAHQKYIETRKKASGLHQRYRELLQKIDDLKQKQRKLEEIKQAERQRQLLEEARKKALEKKKRGEKLSWQEFKLLTEEESM
jgi:uncharacterized coiled-coil DUF342 family protein